MICIDDLFACASPWRGGKSCHLISDTSVGELLDFAKRIGLPMQWFQHRSTIPHFDLAPSWRLKALRAGARGVNRPEFVAAMRRFRAAAEAERAGGA